MNPKDAISIVIKKPKKVIGKTFLTDSLANAFYTLAKHDPETKEAILAAVDQLLTDELSRELKKKR